METISTGEPANLETYRNIALALTGNKNIIPGVMFHS